MLVIQLLYIKNIQLSPNIPKKYEDFIAYTIILIVNSLKNALCPMLYANVCE